MVNLQKIEEWIKEVEERPESSVLILKLIANRLRDLSERNEELLCENIALQDGSRVEEYRRRIEHLEYQLDLLRRQFGPDGLLIDEILARVTTPQKVSLLVYHPRGRIIRLEPDLQELPDPIFLAQIMGDLSGSESPRLLALPSEEEILLLFNSGRVSTCQVSQILALDTRTSLSWEQAALPDEPHGGELLASLMPLTSLPLADFCVQVSRRGCVKKTMTSIAETILSNHFIGRGTLQKADQPFEGVLCRKNARLVLVTYEGRMLGLDVDALTYSTETRIQLEPHDHVVAAFMVAADQGLLCLTQNGKVIYRESSTIEPAKSAIVRGQALISAARLEQGTRFIGAAATQESDQVVILDAGGHLRLNVARDLIGSGVLASADPLLALCILPAAAERPKA